MVKKVTVGIKPYQSRNNPQSLQILQQDLPASTDRVDFSQLKHGTKRQLPFGYLA